MLRILEVLLGLALITAGTGVVHEATTYLGIISGGLNIIIGFVIITRK